MKFGHIIIGIAAVSASSVAHAQNSVTLYGLLDEGINFTRSCSHSHERSKGTRKRSEGEIVPC
ncbi:hypothetical protein PPI47_35920, partial [Burkholderia cenocepacia]|nr:hypothetical protein [Burkholderia cenocepacia]